LSTPSAHAAPAAGADGAGIEAEYLRNCRVYDHEGVQRSFVRRLEDGSSEASLMLEGIRCAGCALRNERQLQELPGVTQAEVNFSTHRARVRWDPDRVLLSDILAAVKRIGYEAHPYDPDAQEALLDSERRLALRRLGVAGAFGMQVMMIAVALYAGEWYGMEEGFRQVFNWVSLALTLPVLAYSARPFIFGALRDLRNRRVGMDVPVSLGLGIAFTGSVHATVTGAGAVYYDSVVMFVFFLLLARYLELMARRHSARLAEALVQPVPVMATRIDADGRHEVVPVAELAVGDRVLVVAGAQIPADGRVLEGRASVDEALLTGESRPMVKRVGDTVIGGSVNLDSPLHIEVEHAASDSMLSRILELVERARNERPQLAHTADRIAGYFVAAVLVLAGLAALYWWQAAPERWLPITVAMLVVTCPCALSLATPTAITAATGALTRRTLIITGSNALEILARATRFVFDKTGTLTLGAPRVVGVMPMSELPRAECLDVAAALERSSEHPVARALLADTHTDLVASDVINTPGGGLEGRVAGILYAIGTPAFVQSRTGHRLSAPLHPPAGNAIASPVLLADSRAVRCAFFISDPVRPEAREVVDALARQGLSVSLYSGDSSAVAAEVAREAGIDDVSAELAPGEKLERVRALQFRGEIVAMVGDGINDTPVLSGADVSVAMGDGAQAARASADMPMAAIHGATKPAAAAGMASRL